jgi:hypothetical protein
VSELVTGVSEDGQRAGAAFQPRHCLCPFFSDAPDWEAIAPLALVDALTGEEPQQRTAVQIAWTAPAFHVRFRAEDSHVWATLWERDDPLYEEEVVEVFIDPFGDLESYFEIEVNPLNTVFDLVLRRTLSGYRKDARWNCEGLRTSTIQDDAGWTVEMSIPFASLGPELPSLSTGWRANFCRIDRPQNEPRELSAWSPPSRPTFHTPERFGVVEFVR